MADELPPAVQDFVADVDAYISGLDKAIAKAEEFIAINDRAAEAARQMGEEAAAAAEVAAEADRGLADAALEAAAATRELADAQAAAIAKKLEEATAAHAAGDADKALAADAELASHGVDSLREALTAVDRDLMVAAEMLDETGHAIERMAADGDEAGRKIKAAFMVADDAIDDAVVAFERAAAAVGEFDGDASKLVGVEEAVARAASSAADAVSKSARAMELAGVAAGTAAEGDARLAEASGLAAEGANLLSDAQAEAVRHKIEEAGAAAAAGEADKALAAASALAAAATAAMSAAMATSTARATASATATAGAATAAKAAGAAAGAATGFWARWGNVIHWVVAGGVEVLATLIPAMVALGGAALVGMQGAQMLQEHLTALWTAAEATGNVFHQTMGTMLGMKSVLQQAQDAANPHIFALLGAGIGIVNEQAGKLTQAGSQVILVFDRFAARLQYDFSKAGGAGDTMNALLKAMVPDLIEFGQVFGNIGHAIANFASKMPGLAEVLLKIADAASRVILAISNLPTWLIMSAMAMEEIWRWGVPLVAILTKIPVALAGFVSSGFGVIPVALRIAEVFRALAAFGPVLVANLAGVVGAIAPAGSAFGNAANSVAAFSARLAAAIQGMTVFQALAGVALLGAIVAVGIALTRTRSSVEQFDDSFNRMIATAKNANVMTYIATDFQTATARIQQQTQVLGRYSGAVDYVASTNAKWTGQLRNMEGPLAGAGQGAQNLSDKINILAGRGIAAIPGMEGLGHAYEGLFTASHAASAVQQLNAAQQQQVSAMTNVSTGMGYLQEKYHLTAQQALALADAAGVKLASGLTGATEAAVINRTMIQQLVDGYKAMGQGAGEVGTDMTALAIQSGLAASKVSQLNQAWDQFMQGLTGGTSGLAALNIGIQNMGQVVASAKNNLSKYTGSMNENVNAFAQSLKSFSGKGAAAWQQFNQVVGSTAPQLIDWLRQAGQEGALGANSQEKFTRAVADISAKLVGFASASKPARAELMGLASAADHNITSWPQFVKWVDKTKGSASDLGKTISGATGQLENMGSVAQALGNVLNNSLAKMMEVTRLKAFGVQQAFQNLGNQLAAMHPNAAKIASTFQALNTTLTRVFGPTQARQMVNAYLGTFGDTLKNGMVVPIKNAHDGGAKAAKGMADGLTSGKGKVTSSMSGIFQAVNGIVANDQLPSKMKTHGSATTQGFHDGAASKKGTVTSFFSALPGEIVSALGDVSSLLDGQGASIMGSLLSGLQSAWGGVKSFIGGIAGWISSHKGPMEADAVLLVPHGAAIMQGLINGMRSKMGDLTGFLHQVSGTVPGGLAIGANGVPIAWEAEKIGKDTIRQLIKGLTGSDSQIKAAIKDITDAVKKAFAAGKLNTGNWNSFLGEHNLLAMIGNDNKKLQALAAQRQKIANEIQKANQYASSVTSSIRQEAGLGNLTQPTDPTTGKTTPWTVTDVQTQMTSQLKQMQAFDHNIDVLRKEGLNKQMIAQIVAMGYQQGGALAQALAHGSASQIKDLNDTEKAILKASKKIGKDAANSMYDTGKNAGKGFLSGLKSEEKAIENEIKKIADDIVKAIRKALKSHSPSMVMHDEGMNAALGLAQGLTAGTPMVVAAARKMAAAVAGVKIQVSPVMTHPLVPVTSAGVNAGGPVVIVHQHIAGSVLSQQQLQQHLQTGVLQYAHRNPGNGLSTPVR